VVSRNKIKRTITVLALTVVALVGLGVVASPAQASIPSYCNVDTGHDICLWTSPNFTGSLKHFQLSAGCFSLVYPFDDNVSSVVVGGLGHDYSLWTGTACTGTRDPWYGHGTKVANMSGTIVGDNEAGSVSFP
jgi:hypothetical protein